MRVNIAQRGLTGFLLCVILFAISACSVQKADSSLNSSKISDNERAENSAALKQQPREKEPVRVNYLASLNDIVSPEIYVYKEKRRLYILQSNVMVRDYPIGLGALPVGDKEKAGDGRTPEGDFVVCGKGPASTFSKTLVLSYPDRKHAERALFSGIISQSEFNGILSAAERKAAPPANTKLGGGLFIHAGGAYKDWTEGAIALYESDMEELYKIASTGTPIHIRP